MIKRTVQNLILMLTTAAIFGIWMGSFYAVVVMIGVVTLFSVEE